MDKYDKIGIIKNEAIFNEEQLNLFSETIKTLKKNKTWNKGDIVNLFFNLIPDFGHKETGKYLDNKM
jgi:hypothetical protein